MCAPVVDDDPLAAAGAEAEADGVADVTKQLEKQAIEDKEKEEDGEEGDLTSRPMMHVSPRKTLNLLAGVTTVFSPAQMETTERTRQGKRRRRKRRRKDVSWQCCRKKRVKL